MSVDMTRWCEIAKENVRNRPAGAGRMAGKICIVTGAAQGFGKGIAQELYNEGATVVIADMNEPLAKQVAEEFGARASPSQSTSMTRRASRRWSARPLSCSAASI